MSFSIHFQGLSGLQAECKLTASSSYNLPAIQAHLAGRPASYRTHVRMFDTECLHTPYLPPPSGSSTFRGNINGASSPVIKPHHRDEPVVPEGDLLNLNDPAENGVISVGGWKNGSAKKKRKTGFTKGPGGEGGRRKSVQRADSSESNEGVLDDDYSSGATGGDSTLASRREGDGAEDDDSDDDWEEEEWVPDVFLFEYGTVVIWGMTEKEEKAFLRSL